MRLLFIFNLLYILMTFLSSLLHFANQILTFYLPVFFTFKFLASHEAQNIAKILKFWCVLTMCYILQFFLSIILDEKFDIFIDLALHILLIYEEFKFSEQIYDSIVKPLYHNNQDLIDNFSKKIESYFHKTSQEVSNRVAQSATDKIRGFVGDVLVGTLNPNNKVAESVATNEENDSQDD